MKKSEYRGVTIKDYNKAQQLNSDKMFALFDKDEKTYKNGNRGLSLMWAIGFTTSCISKQSIDRHLNENIPLDIAILKELIVERPDGYIFTDLNLLLNK